MEKLEAKICGCTREGLKVMPCAKLLCVHDDVDARAIAMAVCVVRMSFDLTLFKPQHVVVALQ